METLIGQILWGNRIINVKNTILLIIIAVSLCIYVQIFRTYEYQLRLHK